MVASPQMSILTVVRFPRSEEGAGEKYAIRSYLIAAGTCPATGSIRIIVASSPSPIMELGPA